MVLHGLLLDTTGMLWSQCLHGLASCGFWAICGLVLFILSKSDFVALDRFATSKGRYLMRGQACVKTVQADGSIKYAAISNDDVLGYLGLADSFTELRIRRLQFWQRSVACPEKVHAVVARSTFRSQNVQNTPFSDHFWKLRCRKSARRCGAKHISKSKCTKHLSVGPLLEVAMSKKCMPLWRKANVKSSRGSDHFWKSRCRKSGRCCGAKDISKSKC